MSKELFKAVRKRSLKAIDAAIEDGADLDAADDDDDGNTALCMLCKSNSGDMSKTEIAAALWLIERGADVMKPNHDAETPLHLVAASGSREVIDALIAKGATVTRTKLAYTPLHYSLDTNAKDTWIWDRLIEIGCGIDDRTKSGDTPLLDAVSHYNVVATKYLLEKGADRTIRDSHGKTAEENAVNAKMANLALKARMTRLFKK
jgi:ankyrin repeat protein